MNYSEAQAWIRRNKHDRPEAAGALAYIIGYDANYGCHDGMRSTRQAIAERYSQGWDMAWHDCNRPQYPQRG